jgi:hypothetical protein
MTWAPDYVTKDDLKAYLRIDSGDTVDDAQLPLAVTSSSRAVDLTTHRQFGQVAAPEARLYTPRWDSSRCRWVIEIDDLMTVTGLTLNIAAGAITQYQLEPLNAAQRGRPWTRLVISKDSTIKPKGEVGEATMVAKWGWLAVPDTVKEATLIQGSRFNKRRDAPFGVAGSPESGSELRLLAKVDPDVAVMLASYTRRRLSTG